LWIRQLLPKSIDERPRRNAAIKKLAKKTGEFSAMQSAVPDLCDISDENRSDAAELYGVDDADKVRALRTPKPSARTADSNKGVRFVRSCRA